VGTGVDRLSYFLVKIDCGKRAGRHSGRDVIEDFQAEKKFLAQGNPVGFYSCCFFYGEHISVIDGFCEQSLFWGSLG